MRILIIGNGRIDLRDRSFYCNKHIGALLKKLNESENTEATYGQFIHKSANNDNLTDYNLTTNNIQVAPLNIDYSNKFKLINYLSSIVNILLQFIKTDFVYIFWPGRLAKIAGVLSRLFGKRYGLYLRGDFQINTISKFIIQKAEFCLSVSPYFADKISNLCDKVYSEPPLIDISTSDIFDARPSISEGIKTFLFVGRIEKAKGIYELIDAFEHLIEKGMDVYLNLVGGGDLFAELKGKISNNNLLKDRIIFAGMISDKNQLLKLYHQSDAFIIPSHTEGFPRVIYEAMAAKIPIYTTFVGGIPYLMKDGINCIELPLKDSKGIYTTVLNTFQNPKLLNLISSNALDQIQVILNDKQKDHASTLYDIISGETNVNYNLT